MFKFVNDRGAIDYILKPATDARIIQAVERYMTYRRLYATIRPLTQESLDTYYSHPTPIYTLNLSKLDNKKLEGIIEFMMLIPRKEYTADIIAENIGVSVVTARKYLSWLNSAGVVYTEAVKKDVGRPRIIYKLNPPKKQN